MNTENKPKAKRKLKDINFQVEGAHIALVSKEQGGGANNCNYALVMKSANFSEEFITKMQQVKVTLELPEFLQKFFGVWYEDAQVLAAMLGYVEVEDDEVEDDYYTKYIQEKLQSFEIIKSLHEAKSLPEAISKLTEDEFLLVRQDQQKVEKALESKEKDDSLSKDKSKPSTVKVEKTTKDKSKKKETNMDEVIELQKALDAQKEELTKALASIAAFQEKEKEAIQKAKLQKIKDAVKDEAKATVLFKALNLVQDEAEFTEIVKALSDMQALVEKSELFKETGATEEVEAVKESNVAKVIKAKFSVK